MRRPPVAPRPAHAAAALAALLLGAPAAASDFVASGALQVGQPLAHGLALSRGQVIDGQLDADDARLRLRGPDGQALRLIGRASRAQALEFRIVAPTTGRYRLEIEPAQDSAYRLTWQRPWRRPHRPAAAGAEAAAIAPALAALARRHRVGSPAFWQALQARGTPLLEALDGGRQYRVSFVWRGEADTAEVRLLWPLYEGAAPALRRWPGSDLWHASVTLPAGTRASYQFAPDPPLRAARTAPPKNDEALALDAVAQADPLNPRHFPLVPGLDRHARHSVLALPAAPDRAAAAATPTAPAANPPAAPVTGDLYRERFASARLGNTRTVTVWRPPAAAAGAAPPALLLLFDGDGWTDLVQLPARLEPALAAHRLPPLLVVLVGNASDEARNRELPCHEPFAEAVATELLPWLAARERFSDDPARRVVGGVSYGGLAAACLALQHPQQFGAVLSLSGAFWWAPAEDGAAADVEPEWLAREIAARPAAPVRFYLAAGRFEIGRDEASPGIRSSNRHLAQVLRARGLRVQRHEFLGGHDWLQWGDQLLLGLDALTADWPRSP